MGGSIAASGGTVNSDLYNYSQLPNLDAKGFLSPMCYWNILSLTDYRSWLALGTNTLPLWPATGSNQNLWVTSSGTMTAALLPLATTSIFQGFTSATSVNYATTTPTAASPVTSAQITTMVLTSVNLFCFMMLYNQLGAFRGTGITITSSDKIQQICIDAVTASNLAIPLNVPGSSNPSTTTATLTKALASATTAVNTFLLNYNVTPNTSGFIDSMDLLGGLLPRMFTPYWTIRYYSSFATGGIAGANFYDQRYSQLAVAMTFDPWLKLLITGQPSNTNLQPIYSWITAVRNNLVTVGESSGALTGFYTSNKAQAVNNVTNIGNLQGTNGQFQRRQGSVGSMSENLAAVRKKTDLALATLLVWIATLVTSLAVAAFLLRQKDYPLVLALVIATITLLTVDALGRGLAGTQPNPYA